VCNTASSVILIEGWRFICRAELEKQTTAMQTS
jgi:uncharacterized membrane protein YozB (DUF420 family)